jgi:hypothetical protein
MGILDFNKAPGLVVHLPFNFDLALTGDNILSIEELFLVASLLQ